MVSDMVSVLGIGLTEYGLVEMFDDLLFRKVL